VLELLLGLIIALVVNSSFKGRGLMRAAMLVPWAIPTVVSAVLWRTLLLPDQTGIFNKLLMNLGILSKPEQWFAPNGPWMNSIIAVDVWKTAPFMALLILAGLQIIPGDLYEAASVDGASKLRQFFSITLPLLRPTIAVALIFRTLDSLRVFDVFSVLLDTSRPSMATYNYNRLVLTRADGYASAVGVIIFLLIFIFTVVYVRFVGMERE
jgi:trehalose/maltose transport system permease protein